MKTLSLCVVLLLLFVKLSAQNRTYYLSPAGSDSNNGLTTTTPWQTLSKVSTYSFSPGDRVLFQGGQIFTGSLQFQSEDSGTPANPLYIGSYGLGRAIIHSNASNALLAYNVGGIEIHNLIFTGNGVASTSKDNHGVNFYIDQASGDLDHIRINNIDVSGFGGKGILFGSGSNNGYNNVRITNSMAHDNGMSGIESYGNWPEFSHTDFYVGYCIAFGNYGRSDYTTNHSGSGIVLSGIDGALIEYCEAYDNGRNNAHRNSGPVGIWFYDLKNGIIQFSESHHNKAGQNADGAGFDLDGGSENCLIQYCYSHDNEGTGYGLFEYGSPNAFRNNVIRYNISQNDGRKNSSGGIAIWAVDESHKVSNSEVYNNTVYVNDANLTNGIPSALFFYDNYMSGLSIRNNIFYTTGAARMIRATATFPATAVRLQGNNYFTTGVADFSWGESNYIGLASWKAAAADQEKLGAVELGITLNPKLEAPGSGGNIRPASGGDLQLLTSYQIQAGSPLIDAGLNLPSMFGLNTGTRDFYNGSTPVNGSFDIGAHELHLIVLPIQFEFFGSQLINNQIKLSWKISPTDDLQYFIIELSTNGKDFEEISRTRSSEMPIERTAAPGYCRIKAVTKSGNAYYSGILILPIEKPGRGIVISPNPAKDFAFIQLPGPMKGEKITLKNSSGATIIERIITDSSTRIPLDLSALPSGVYIVAINGAGNAPQSFAIVKQ